jgi:hypothetical protein
MMNKDCARTCRGGDCGFERGAAVVATRFVIGETDPLS